MKYLLMGDIHGNLIALEIVLNKYLKEVDKIICHGDVVNYGPWSNECVEILDSLNVVCLKGNHEDAFIKGHYKGENKLVQEFFMKTYPTFYKQNLIKTYESTYETDYFNVAHTLKNNYYFPDSNFNDIQIDKTTIIGHSHYSFIKKIDENNYLINTGSVGQNRENLNIIEFCIYDSNLNRFEIKHIRYNAELIIKQMIIEDYPINCINYYKSKL
jgi:predicted phosphodiesterase